MRKLFLATASILALGIGGAGLGFAADMSNAGTNAGSNMPAATGMPQTEQADVNTSKNDVRQAQEQLKDQGLYRGAIDGILGPQTKQALQQFQQKSGLPVTATLDQHTMDKLLGKPAVGMGSSTPPGAGQGTQPMANPQPVPHNQNNLGDHTAPNR